MLNFSGVCLKNYVNTLETLRWSTLKSSKKRTSIGTFGHLLLHCNGNKKFLVHWEVSFRRAFDFPLLMGDTCISYIYIYTHIFKENDRRTVDNVIRSPFVNSFVSTPNNQVQIGSPLCLRKCRSCWKPQVDLTLPWNEQKKWNKTLEIS